MKICILTSSYPLSPLDAKAAAGLFVRDFALELAKTGHEIYIFTHAREGDIKDDPELKVIRFNWNGLDKPLARLNPFHPKELISISSLLWNGNRSFWKLAKNKKIDYCLAMWAFPSGYFAWQADKTLQIPYAIWALGSDIWTLGKQPILRGFLKKICRHARVRFADGNDLAKAVTYLSGKECKFLPSARHVPINEIAAADINRDIKNFLFIGRWEKNKGVDLLIEAFHLFIKDGVQARLHLFGGGTLENVIRNRIKHYSLDSYVHINGYCSLHEAVAYLKSCDYLVIPSRVESIPVIFSDALKAQIPLLVTDVGDMGYLTKKFGVGKVVPANNPIALKEGMKELIKEQPMAYKSKMAALAQQFDLKELVQCFLHEIDKSREFVSTYKPLSLQR